MNKKLVLFLIIVIVWMAIVFLFSNQSGTESKYTSGKVIKSSITLFSENQDMSEKQMEKVIKSYQPIVRKLAHLMLYTVGGIVIYTFINTFNISIKKKILFSILIGVIFAIADEIHQYFIPGRTALVKDVLIDTAGIILGVLILIGIKKIILIRKRKENKNG